MDDEKKRSLREIERIAREIAAMRGVEVVEFVFHSQGRHSLLRIDVDRPGIPGAGIADCEAVSRELGDRIDELPFFGSPYELQVSTPGIDRPIRSDDDMRRNTGRPVRVEYRDDANKVRELHGTLAGVGSDGLVVVAHEGSEAKIARDRIVLMKQDVLLGGHKRNKA